MEKLWIENKIEKYCVIDIKSVFERKQLLVIGNGSFFPVECASL